MQDLPDLVISNATVVNADGRTNAHVVVTGGTIVELVDASHAVPQALASVDARGRMLLPGGVDGHCHVAQVTGRFRTLDDYAVTSTAALWGGTTTIIDFGIPRDSDETPLQAARNKISLARESRCDVGLHASVIDWDQTVPAQLEELAGLGIRSVKMYTTNRGSTMADNDTILRVMKQMVRLDGLTAARPSVKSLRPARSAVVRMPSLGTRTASFTAVGPQSSANHRQIVRPSSSHRTAA